MNALNLLNPANCVKTNPVGATGPSPCEAFEGVEKSQEAAEKIIRDVLTNPDSIRAGAKTIDVYNAAGRGVRIEAGTNKFMGFLEAALK